MRGLTREELSALLDLASPIMHYVGEARNLVDEDLVEQGRATTHVVSLDDTYEHVEWHISDQGGKP